MALAFNSLKSTQFAPNDIIPSGKLKGCRVRDVVDDHYEYLRWMRNKGFLTLTNESTQMIARRFLACKEEEYFNNEVRPYLEDIDPFEDIPF